LLKVLIIIKSLIFVVPLEKTMLTAQSETKKLDPRIKRTRKLLTQAFVDLMHEKGFQSITVQDIADRAEVNRATFYAHYEDKYDLLDSYTREKFLDWLTQKNPTLGEFRVDLLTRLVGSIFEFTAQIDSHCGRLDKQLEPMLAAAVQEELSGYLLAWFRQPASEPQLLRQPPEMVAMIWSWAILGAGMQWSRGARTLSLNEMAVQVVEVLTAPLAAAEHKVQTWKGQPIKS
jgi:AcrR family transcriptional regulator